MDLASILLTLAVALLVGLFITRPLLSRRAASEVLIRPATEEVEMHRSTLLAERDRALTSLQDLDFDFTLGKIPEADYSSQRAELLESGADALRQLDELGGVKSATRAEERVEAAVASRRADSPRQSSTVAPRRPPAPAEDDIEAEITARRRARQEKAAGFCPKCGRPVTTSDRFCARCGATL
jgi:hypothetical protein